MSRPSTDGAASAGDGTASDRSEGDRTPSAAASTTDESADGTGDSVGRTDDSAEAPEYEHLRSKKKERKGNAERATVRDVFVGERRVVLTVGFPWTTDTERFVYDLDSDRDVLKLEALAESKGFDFEQVSFLDGESLSVVYTGETWVPEAQIEYVEGEGSAGATFLTELRLLGRELARSPKFVRRLVRLSRTMTTKQLVIAVVLVKKLIVIALVAWLVL
ncbi:hypothetical protein M0R88_01505 [Halorussus gelatinilyticus]|uniref:Uncharacterized protein n=1 Tax=Halorussus gelatinilyticus TaxID=2937524 RepID=A0A8U0IID9_9EURY|nr:hypothetical protein [Halorussus gelatinilyticus]UPW00793.1 hypothetical protein M0R88_01505 [Halorussus gelatinilyticus]